MLVRSSGVSAVLFAGIVLAACGSSPSSRVAITPTATVTATPTASPASTPTVKLTPSPISKPRPTATPIPAFFGQLGGTGSDTFLAVTGVSVGASCQATTFGEPAGSNIVLTAPWNPAVRDASGKYQVTWTKGQAPPGNIVWPASNKMVWPSPSPSGSPPNPVTLRWKARCALQGSTSAWTPVTGPFSFGPPS